LHNPTLHAEDLEQRLERRLEEEDVKYFEDEEYGNDVEGYDRQPDAWEDDDDENVPAQPSTSAQISAQPKTQVYCPQTSEQLREKAYNRIRLLSCLNGGRGIVRLTKRAKAVLQFDSTTKCSVCRDQVECCKDEETCVSVDHCAHDDCKEFICTKCIDDFRRDHQTCASSQIVCPVCERRSDIVYAELSRVQDEEDNECLICTEQFEASCRRTHCSTCVGVVHEACYQMLVQHNRTSGLRTHCPYCRSTKYPAVD